MSNAYTDLANSELDFALRIPWRGIGTVYFSLCCSVIGLISCYDTFLVYLHRDTIFQMEQNPICLKLLELEPVYFSIFTLAKAAGTITVLYLLRVLFRKGTFKPLSVTTCIAFFQLGLLTYLTFG